MLSQKFPKIPHHQESMGVFQKLLQISSREHDEMENKKKIQHDDQEGHDQEDDEDDAGHEDENDLFECFVTLLPLPSYTKSLWLGLIPSLGGMTISTVSIEPLFIFLLLPFASFSPHLFYPHSFA